MNLLKWFLSVREVEFVVDAPLESCLEQVEDYQRYENSYVVSLRPKIELESIKNGEIYELRAEDKANFSSLLLRLERREAITMASGYARFSFVLVFVAILLTAWVFYLFISYVLSRDEDVPLSILICPVFGWAWIWFTYAMRRGSLVRHVRNILKDATIRKRH